jgi:hypothetical protein
MVDAVEGEKTALPDDLLLSLSLNGREHVSKSKDWSRILISEPITRMKTADINPSISGSFNWKDQGYGHRNKCSLRIILIDEAQTIVAEKRFSEKHILHDNKDY